MVSSRHRCDSLASVGPAGGLSGYYLGDEPDRVTECRPRRFSGIVLGARVMNLASRENRHERD
jgi:hypothetical protein